MDVQENGVYLGRGQCPEGLAAGGGPLDGADTVVAAQQERQFLDGGQLIIDDEDVNHLPRLAFRGPTG